MQCLQTHGIEPVFRRPSFCWSVYSKGLWRRYHFIPRASRTHALTHHTLSGWEWHSGGIRLPDLLWNTFEASAYAVDARPASRVCLLIFEQCWNTFRLLFERHQDHALGTSQQHHVPTATISRSWNDIAFLELEKRNYSQFSSQMYRIALAYVE